MVLTANHTCRSCSGRSGQVVLDLGYQPACDLFPSGDDPGPDPLHRLAMWLCSSCGLAQLLGDLTEAEEPLGIEPAVLASQAVDALGRLASAGWLTGRRRVTEFPSPHGGSWLGPLADHGVMPARGEELSDLVVDSFGMMHEPDQFTALTRRAARMAPGGLLVLQYHGLDTIVRLGQWNALRHGHFAYYSTSALVGMLETTGLAPVAAWWFDLYGGTVLLAATRKHQSNMAPDRSVAALLSQDARLGVCDPATIGVLQDHTESQARGLRAWLVDQHEAGRSVLGYGAASRAVALLCRADIDRELLPAVVDLAPAKHGRRMPGTDIPIVGPGVLAATPPHAVLLFVSDLLAEVRRAFPEVERSGGHWTDVEELRVVGPYSPV